MDMSVQTSALSLSHYLTLIYTPVLALKEQDFDRRYNMEAINQRSEYPHA